MSPVTPASNRVFKGFIAQANAAYREAGLPEYQMRIKRDGSVDVPGNPKVARRRTASASAGAAAVPSGAAPKLTQVTAPTADSVQLSWNPVPGAVKYGVWQNGTLIGTVPNPSYVANVPANGSASISIDAELSSGTRTPKTQAVNVSRQGSAAVQANVGSASAAAQGAPAPTATADASAGAAATAP